MARPDLLKLRSLGQNDYTVLEGRQRIGRIWFASERSPGIWIWTVTINLPGGLPWDHRQGRVQGGLAGIESPNPARTTRGGLPGDEYSG